MQIKQFLDSKKGMCIAVSLILLIHFVLVLSSAWNLSFTVDFGRNSAAGYYYFSEGLVSPISVTSQGHLFGLAPLILGIDWGEENKILGYLRSGNNKGLLAFYGVLDKNEMNRGFYDQIEDVKRDNDIRSILRVSYIIESIISVLTALVVFVWAKQAFGKVSGYAALLLFSFSPFMSAIVHGLHSDNLAIFFVTLTFFLLWKFITSTNLKNLIFMSISLGVTMSVKVSTTYYPFLILIVFIIALFVNNIFKGNVRSLFKFKWSNIYTNSFLTFLLLFLISIFVINGLYLFKDTFKPMVDYDYENNKIGSKTFLSLKESFLGKIPLPLPPYYILGIDFGKAWSEGGTKTYLFFMGEIFTERTPKSYYPISFLIKTTLPVLLLFLITHLFLILIFFSNKNEKIKIIEFNLVFVLFIAYFIFIFTTVVTYQAAGLRHLSMIYPMIFISISSILAIKFPLSKIIKPLIMTLLVWHIILYLFVYPFFIPYFNEIIGKNNGYLYFRDTNIDYHEPYYHAIDYKKAHPEVALFPTCLIEKGKVSMSPNDLNFQRAGCYGWLKNFEPVDFIGNSWPVYDVDGKWVQDEDGQLRFIPSSNMGLRNARINPFLKRFIQ